MEENKLFYKDGSIYIGDISNNLPNGKGKISKILNYPVYEGDFKDGEFHGLGKFFWEDGAYYKGDFKKGKKDGLGFLKMPNGEYYEGDFKDENITGTGYFQMMDGSRYLGEFSDCRKSGYGKEYYYGNKLKYEGNYANDKFNGIGKLYSEPQNHLEYNGLFHEGQPANQLNQINQNASSGNNYLLENNNSSTNVSSLGNNNNFGIEKNGEKNVGVNNAINPINSSNAVNSGFNNNNEKKDINFISNLEQKKYSKRK